MLSIASEGLYHNGLSWPRPGFAWRVEIAHYEPIADQAGHQNQRREHERGGIGPRPADQESCHARREDAGDVSDKVFHARPHADLIRRSASLQDGQDVAGRKSDKRGCAEQPNGISRARDSRRGNEKQPREERQSYHPLPRASLIPAETNQAVGNPASQRLAGSENEIGERRV